MSGIDGAFDKFLVCSAALNAACIKGFDPSLAFAKVIETTATATATAMPSPAVLLRFATGIGGLGLLGWRRKRKGQAVA